MPAAAHAQTHHTITTKCRGQTQLTTQADDDLAGSDSCDNNRPINQSPRVNVSRFVSGDGHWFSSEEAKDPTENKKNMDPSSCQDKGERWLHQFAFHRQGQ